jgi:hypothetical protein
MLLLALALALAITDAGDASAEIVAAFLIVRCVSRKRARVVGVLASDVVRCDVFGLAVPYELAASSVG